MATEGSRYKRFSRPWDVVNHHKITLDDFRTDEVYIVPFSHQTENAVQAIKDGVLDGDGNEANAGLRGAALVQR